MEAPLFGAQQQLHQQMEFSTHSTAAAYMPQGAQAAQTLFMNTATMVAPASQQFPPGEEKIYMHTYYLYILYVQNNQSAV